MKIDHIKTLIDQLEKAVEQHSGEIDCGWDRKAEAKAKNDRKKARQALIKAIEKGLR